MKQTSKGLLLPIVYCTSIFAGLLGVNHTQLLYISKVQVNLLHSFLKILHHHHRTSLSHIAE